MSSKKRSETYTVGDVVTVDGNGSSLESGRLGITVGSTIGLFEVGIGRDTKISSIDICLFTITGTESFLDESLVGPEDFLEFLGRYVVEEDTFTELAIDDCESLLSVSGLPELDQR